MGKIISLVIAYWESLFGLANVKRYGAIGDGVTDDTEAFEKAERALKNGGSIYVPPGTYIVSYRIRKDNIKLIGAGWDTILKTPPNATKLINDCPLRIFGNNCVVRDLKIDGNKENNTHLNTAPLAREADGIGIYSNYNTIENVWVHGALGHHIIAWNDFFEDENHPSGARHHNSVRYCLVTERGLRNMVDFASTKDLGVGYDENINYNNELIGNKIHGNIVIHTGWDTLIQGNMCESIGLHSGSRRVTIKDNIVNGAGIYVQGGLDTAIDQEVRRSRDIVIEGNTVSNAKSSGIAGESIDNLIIRGNKVISPTREGIKFGRSTKVTIENNEVIDAGTASMEQSYASHSIDNLIIRNNYIENPAEYAINVGLISNALIEGNQFNGGMRILNMVNYPSSKLVIRNNRGVNQSQYGFIVRGDNVVISDNIIEDCQGWAFQIYSNDTLLEKNVIKNSTGSIRFDSSSETTGAIIKQNVLNNTTSYAINGRKGDAITKHNIIDGVWIETGVEA